MLARLHCYIWIGTLLLTGCTSARDFEPEAIQARQEWPRRVQLKRVRIPADPARLIKAFEYPEGTVRQRLIWSQQRNEWHVFFHDTNAELAGYYLRRPVAPLSIQDDLILYMEVSPTFGVSSLSIGLLDESLPPMEVPMLDMASYLLAQQPERTRSLIAIPLRDFDVSQTFNWNNLRGVQIRRRLNEVGAATYFEIWNLQVAPEVWVKPRGHQAQP